MIIQRSYYGDPYYGDKNTVQESKNRYKKVKNKTYLCNNASHDRFPGIP